MDTTLLAKIFIASSLLLSLASASAQAPGSFDAGEAARQRRESDQVLRDLQQKDASAPSLYPEEESDVGPQSIVRVKPRPSWFDLALDSQLFYTDNLFFQEKDKTGSSVFVNTAQLALAPPAVDVGNGSLRPRLGYRHQWYNYGLVESDGDKNNFDFDAQTFFADASYRWNNWHCQLGLDWNRLLSHEPDYFDYHEFYTEYAPRWSVHRVFHLDERLTFMAGYLGSYHFSDVDPTFGQDDEDRNDRWDHVLLINCTYAVCPKWVAQPYYRLQFTDYTHESREDFLHSFGLAVAWFCNKYVNVRGFIGYDLRESNDSRVADYRVLNAGGGVNVNFRF